VPSFNISTWLTRLIEESTSRLLGLLRLLGALASSSSTFLFHDWGFLGDNWGDFIGTTDDLLKFLTTELLKSLQGLLGHLSAFLRHLAGLASSSTLRTVRKRREEDTTLHWDGCGGCTGFRNNCRNWGCC